MGETGFPTTGPVGNAAIFPAELHFNVDEVKRDGLRVADRRAKVGLDVHCGESRPIEFRANGLGGQECFGFLSADLRPKGTAKQIACADAVVTTGMIPACEATRNTEFEYLRMHTSNNSTTGNDVEKRPGWNEPYCINHGILNAFKDLVNICKPGIGWVCMHFEFCH